MNKKIIGITAIAIFAAIIIIIGIIASKGAKLEEVKLPLQIDFLERTVSVTVGYPKNKGIIVENTDSENTKVFKNEKENYSLDITLTEDSTYKENKNYSKEEEEGYQEVKFNNYTGYIVRGDYNIEGKILLEDISDQNTYVYLSIELSSIESYVNDNLVDVNPLYDLKEVQKILNSVKYNSGENTVEQTKQAIEDEEEKEKTSNYGEFKDRLRTEGTSDKDGLIFIPSFKSPNESLYKAEQKNDNVGVDNYLWYISDKKAYEASGIEVRIFPKSGNYESMKAYIKEKGDMYHWTKQKIAGKEYDTFTFGSDSTTPAKYSKYHNGAFMIGNRVVEFSYNMYSEIPDQNLGDTFFNQIIDSIEYSKDFK